MNTITLKDNQHDLTRPKEKADKLASHFQQISHSAPKPLTESIKNEIEEAGEHNTEDYNKQITTKEVAEALKNTKNGSQGEDFNTYRLLKALP